MNSLLLKETTHFWCFKPFNSSLQCWPLPQTTRKKRANLRAPGRPPLHVPPLAYSVASAPGSSMPEPLQWRCRGGRGRGPRRGFPRAAGRKPQERRRISAGYGPLFFFGAPPPPPKKSVTKDKVQYFQSIQNLISSETWRTLQTTYSDVVGNLLAGPLVISSSFWSVF